MIFLCFIRKNILLYRLTCTWIIVETLTFFNAESNMYKIHVELTVTVDVINFIQPFISCVLNMIPKLVVSFSRVDWWASFVLYYGLWVYMLPVQVMKFCYMLLRRHPKLKLQLLLYNWISFCIFYTQFFCKRNSRNTLTKQPSSFLNMWINRTWKILRLCKE